MRATLLSILGCPRCEGDLEIASGATSSEILDGALRCRSCASTYPVEAGIPNLLVGAENAATREHYSMHWQLHEVAALESEGIAFGRRGENIAKDLFEMALGGAPAGGWLLDAGCGRGYTAVAIARQHPDIQVVAFDLSSSLGAVARRGKDLPNLHTVRGDVSCPPFKRRAFRRVTSLGVLHHTADTARAFEAIARLVEPRGVLLVWIYPHPTENEGFRGHYKVLGFLRSAVKRLPFVKPETIIRGTALVLLPFAVVATKRGSNAKVLTEDISLRDRYRQIVFVYSDELDLAFMHVHTRQEVLGWYRRHGFVGGSADGGGMYWGERSVEVSPHDA